MRRIYFFLFFLLAIYFQAAGQSDGSVRGRLRDTAARLDVTDATITVLDARDSSLAGFGRSRSGGLFDVGRLRKGSYRLLVSHVGYRPVSRTFVISDSLKAMDIGEIALMDKSHMLDSVTVERDVAPIIMRHDTIEYNAGSFHVKPNAVVEDLLKKLPGVQVDRGGNIKAGGEQVHKVLVDGKEFFGNDPKIATKNLPADAVDKVQVFDKKSDQAQFTGFDDGKSEKTINLTIKKDRKHGVFGKVSAGGGRDAGSGLGRGDGLAGSGLSNGTQDGRFDAGLNLNQFNDTRRLSVLGMWNNVNKQGFSFQDVLGFSGMSGGSITLGGGSIPVAGLGQNSTSIATTRAGGVNYSDSWKNGSDMNTSYFYNRADDRSRQQERKQYLAPENAFNQDHTSTSDWNNENHRVSFNPDIHLDSFNSVKVTSSFTSQRSSGSSSSIDSSRGRTNNELLNTSASTFSGYSKGFNWDNSVLFRHRFAKKGRTLSANFSLSLNDMSGGGSNYSINRFAKTGGADTINQVNQQSGHGNDYGVVLNYTEPLSKRTLLEASYQLSQSHSASGKQTFNGDGTGKFTEPNQQLTNDLRNTFTYHREGIALRHQRPSFSFTVGAALQQASSLNRWGYLVKDSMMEMTYQNLLPNALAEYNISKYKNMRMQYFTSTNQPNIYQLQPVPNNADPLNIVAGNPELRQEYNHALQLHYNAFDPFLRTSFVAMIGFNSIQHRIVTDNRLDSLGVRMSRPANLEGLYNLNGMVNWDFPIRGIHSMLNLRSDILYDNNASLVNGARNNGKTWAVGQEAGLQFAYKEILDLSASAKAEYNDVRYSLQPGQSLNYWTQSYSFDGNWYFAKVLSLSTDISYIHRSGLPAGYNVSPLVWNASVGAQVLKNKRGMFRLHVFDILQQNTGFSRNTSQNFIDDMSSKVLNRYWLLSFTLSINRFAGKAIKGGGPIMGPDIKIIR